jgi:putative ABC transport system permease protein
MNRWPLAARLAVADLLAEPIMAACSALGIAAVLAPLLVLAGLRDGVVAGLRDALLQDPRTREIVSAAHRDIPAATLARLAARPDVVFLVPRTRSLSASMLVARADSPDELLRVELIPTAPGDPLVPPLAASGGSVVSSAAAAARLRLAPGDRLLGRVPRLRAGVREGLDLPLVLSAVAAPAATARVALFVPLPLALLVEDYQDGMRDGREAPGTERASFAGFRLYARRLEDVPRLDADLHEAGFDVVSRAGDVARLMRVDRSLTLIFIAVAALGAIGYLVSLGAGLTANVERKRRGLALLRFTGLGTASLALFPVVQAALLSLAGAGLALGSAFAMAALVNHGFAGVLGLDRPLCVISAPLAAGAAAVTLAGACAVALWAALVTARLEPWEGVRPA